MSLITDAIIGLVRAWRAYVGVELCPEQGDFMDDDIQYLSRKSYVEKVLPYHRRLVSALWGAGPHHMHLCGNVQRHFPTLTRELNVKSFETGFPIDFSTLRDEVGNDVEIEGGVRPAELVTLTPEEIYAKTRAILASGIMRGGRFIMREANNLAPMTPIENLAAMYAAVKEHGVYSVSGPQRPTTS